MKNTLNKMIYFLILCSILVLYTYPVYGEWIDRNDPIDQQQRIFLQGSYWPKHIYLYNNQTTLLVFQKNAGVFTNAQVRIDGGQWYDEYDNHFTQIHMNPFDYINDMNDHLLELKIWFEDGNSAIFDFTLHVVPSRQEFYYDGNSNYMSYWQGGTSEFDRPILIVEGFDPSNLNYPSFYYFKGETFFENILNNNGDIFMLDLAEGGASIATNAQIVKSAVEYLDNISTGDDKVVLVGLSMGGVVCRYSLAEAEDPTRDNDPLPVSTFLSIDSPQQFATIERSFQDYIDDHDDGDPSPSLNCDAAKQMLIYNTYCSQSVHTDFYNELNSLNGDGYPHANGIKNIAVSFSPNIDNPHVGQWARIVIPNGTDEFFHFTTSDPEHLPGSWLPLDNTRNWGYGGPLNLFWYYVVRTGNYPTFIPHKSALDLDANGYSKFDITLASAVHGFHDEFPTGYDTDGQILIDHLMDILFLGDDSYIDFYCYNKIEDGRDAFGQLRVTGGEDNVNYNVTSGDSVSVKANDNYDIETLEQKRVDYASEGIDYMHHDWNVDYTDKKLIHPFLGWHNGGIQTANFHALEKPDIQTDYTIEFIKFADPWYKDSNGEQNNSFRQLFEVLISGKLEVFKENRPDNLRPEIPYYSIHAQNIIADNNGIYQFQSWDVIGADLWTHPEHLSNPCYKAIVFNDASIVSIKSVYTKISDIPNHTAIVYEGDILDIPAGANFTCAEGFTIEVEGSLVAEGTKEQPINITGSGREANFTPFNYVTPELPQDKLISITGQNSVVKLKHIKIENTYCPIAITSNNNYVELKNAEISETNIGVLIEDFNNSQIMIDSVYFRENDAGISLPKQLPGEEQKTYLFVMHSVFSNNQYGIYVSPVYTITNYQSTLRFGIVNNTFYNSGPSGSAIYIRPAQEGSYYYGQFGGAFVYNIFHTSDIDVGNFYNQYGSYSSFQDYGNMIDDLSRITSSIFYFTIEDDPIFLDALNDNFHLSVNSPAIDLGEYEFYADYIDDDIDENDPIYFEIETDPDGTNFDYGAYYVPKLQGTISEDMTIGGEIQVLNYLTIADGITLTIEENSTIFFNAFKRINVYGSLLAQGTSTNKIKFTRSDPNNTSPTYWQGIYGISADNLDLKHCEIEGAMNGVYIKYEPASVDNVEFNTCNTGIKFYYSDNSTITNSQFYDCGNAINFSHSTSYLNSNTIENCNYGIWSIRGYGSVRENNISNNNYDGLYLTDMSALQLETESEGEILPVNNIIENNQRYGVYVSSNSNPNLGTYFELPEMIIGGFNRFNLEEGQYDIYSLNESIIKAEVNYWPEGAYNNGIIDIYPAVNDLKKEIMLPKIIGLGKITNFDSLEHIISIADSLVANGNFRDAIGLYKGVISAEPDEKISIKALIRIVSSYKETKDLNSLLSELDDIYNSFQNNKIGTAALDNSVTIFSLLGDYNEALSRIETVLNVYSADPLMIEETAAALYQQSMIYESLALFSPGLGKDALLANKNSNLQKIIEEYPDTDIAKYLMLFEGYEYLFIQSDIIPEEFELNPAYPNPFNSTVNFQFGLKEDANVDLIVFDILGRKVWEHKTSNKMVAGYHTIRWNGTNDVGNSVASGLYLVKFKANNFTASQKVILVK